MENHSKKRFLRFHVLYHFVTVPLAIAVLIWCIVNLIQSFRSGEDVANASLLMLLGLCLVCTVTIVRSYATKTQDRIIRMEEQFRYYRLTGQELNPELTISQIIALRNAADREFPKLCARAATDNLSPAEIRSEIKEWRSDKIRI